MKDKGLEAIVLNIMANAFYECNVDSEEAEEEAKKLLSKIEKEFDIVLKDGSK